MRGKDMRFVRWGLFALLLVLAAAVLFAAAQWTRARSAGAAYDGSFDVAGLAAPVSIHRDDNAVPHIVAANPTDAYFALGFAHAQDRLWQMDLSRRSPQGRLAEIFGNIALDADIYHRSLQFAPNVEASWAAMPASDKEKLEAYADGVNAWIASDAYRPPAEYVLTLTRPEPWAPTDSLYVQKAIWLTLSLNLRTETTRARLGAKASDAIARAFLPPYPAEGHVAMAWPDLARTLGLPMAPADGAEDGRAGDQGVAKILSAPDQENSNDWVVAGSRTTSGAPMLADDPHLAFSMPGFWYLAHLKIGDRNVIGATIPGIPAVIVGRNDDISWGVTNNRTDVQDLYLERVNPEDAMQYATPDGWARFDAREETIKVRFGKDVQRTFLRSRHGPVLTEELSGDWSDPAVVRTALQWTSLTEIDTTISAMMNNVEPATVDEFVEVLRDKYVGPVQNLVFAHRDGTTGLMVVGRAPIRADGHETRGLSPADGANAANDWRGYIPKELTPLVINPSSGALVTANAKVTPDEYPYVRAIDFANPSRQQRIQDLLDATPAHDVASFQAIQLDVGTTNVDAIKSMMLAAEPSGDAEAMTIRILKDWDGRWTAEALGPLVYATWTREFLRAIAEDDLGDAFDRFFRYEPEFLASVLENDLTEICDDARTDAIETCLGMLNESLATTATLLNEANGAALSRPWGEVYVAEHPHLGLAAFPVIGPILSRETPRASGPDAPNVGYFDYAELPARAVGGGGPSLRMVFDMSDMAASWFALPNGQSGHFTSPHYDDLQRKWLAGDYFRIETDIDAIGTAQVIDLTPAP